MPVDTPSAYYASMLEKWERCRDAAEGEDAIKGKGTAYLPTLDIHKTRPEKYAEYLLRATFYPAFGRTVQGLVGAVFQKKITVNVPPGIEDHTDDITRAGETLETFGYGTLIEKLITGRYGILVDMAAEGGVPYWIRWRAEAILSVQRQRVEGIEILTRVILQESTELPGDDEFTAKYVDQIRVLELLEKRYQVRLYRREDEKENSGEYIPHIPDGQEAHEAIPLRRAAPLPFIPFVLPDDQKPPLLDLAGVNLSHYRNSADFEHGLHQTGIPIPWIAGSTAEKGKPLLAGPDAWIEVAEGGKVGIIQADGALLGALVQAMESKQKTMAMLGARLLEEQPRTQDTATAVRMRHGGEHATLRTEAGMVEADLSRALKMHAWWYGTEANLADVEATVELNKDFLPEPMNPQMLRELVAAVMSDSISAETFYFNLQRGEITRPGVEFEDEKAAIIAGGGGTPQPLVADSGEGEDDE